MYEILIKSNPAPIFIYDEENLIFLEVNDAALFLYGYTKEEFLQMDLTDLYSPEDIQNLLETSEEIVKEGEFSKPYRHRKKDGTFIYVQISKIKFKYQGKDSVFNTVKDVTELIELEKNNHLYKTAFYNTSDLIFLTDASGIITFVNDVVTAKLGIPGNELLKSLNERFLSSFFNINRSIKKIVDNSVTKNKIPILEKYSRMWVNINFLSMTNLSLNLKIKKLQK